ncbi:hypothetical protein SDC9_127535 [bioreactor metagenome]|uniref:Uncharacterized protein n=1 Tax=bioreactor metagenome TaxID=1076179 RepID=A0A645CUE3_9ZZZZ
MRARAADDELLSAALSPRARHRNAQAPAQVRAGDGFFVRRNLLRRANGNHFTAVFARARANVHHIVGRTNRFFVVFHHNERIPEVAHGLERLEQARVVPLMQTDARLVENVEHPHQPAANLRREADALRFAAGERHRGTRER